ncbi:MAG TPA: carboxymuconolactone decarboxylase family protein [Dehalococcoidia bacterium]|nr:carboxymuconolactone decarboxylase family protein [Dehalococcoidia bacterium]
MPVVRLVDEPEDEELRALYERMSEGGGIVPGVLNVFKTVAHNPRLLRAWMRMGTVLLAPGGITLSPRLREIAILRIAQQCGSEYEFAHHIPIAKAVGLSEEEISSLQDFDESPLFSELDRALIRYTDALASMSSDASDLARQMKRWLSDRELVELSFCIGHWGMVARVLVPLEVPVDESLEATLPQEWREWL